MKSCLICVVGIIFASCAVPQVEKITSMDAQKITYLQKIPQGCELLGEIKAEEGNSQSTQSMLGLYTERIVRNNVDVRLRNQAASYGSDTKIAVHKLTTFCTRLRGSRIESGRVVLDYETSMDCASMKTQYPNEAFMVYLEAYAYLYRCAH